MVQADAAIRDRADGALLVGDECAGGVTAPGSRLGASLVQPGSVVAADQADARSLVLDVAPRAADKPLRVVAAERDVRVGPAAATNGDALEVVAVAEDDGVARSGPVHRLLDGGADVRLTGAAAADEPRLARAGGETVAAGLRGGRQRRGLGRAIAVGERHTDLQTLVGLEVEDRSGQPARRGAGQRMPRSPVASVRAKLHAGGRVGVGVAFKERVDAGGVEVGGHLQPGRSDRVVGRRGGQGGQ